MTQITVSFPHVLNEQERPMIWFAAWLVGDAGVEGDWFHSARGAAEVTVAVPAEATGLRVRKWPNDGFDAEYADLLDLRGQTRVEADALDFDIRQRFSRLPDHI
ncbi:MAG: hypothetical protein ACKVVT_08005, partial [Dehalococcoidia bacterium]